MLQVVLVSAALLAGQPAPLPIGSPPANALKAAPAEENPRLEAVQAPPPSKAGPDLPSPSTPTLPAPSEPPSPGTEILVNLRPTAVLARQQPPETPPEPEPLMIAAPFAPAALQPTLAAGLAPTGTGVVPDRWWLMREVQGTWLGALLDDNRLYMTGWIEQSYTASTDKVTNSTVVWNDRANDYLMQQAWVRFGRSVVVAGTTEPTFGFQIDVLNGSDYRFTLPRGLLNSQLVNSAGTQNLYGVDLIQHYVAMYVPTLFRGVEFRFGRLYTPWGVESLEAVSTPLLSRSYAFNFSPPFTHCGLGAYVTFTQKWSGVFMLTNGNDVYFGDPSEELRFVGNIKYTQPGGRNTVTFATSLGRGKFNPAYATPPQQSTVALATEPFGRNNFNAFDVVWTHTFTPVLSYNMEAIYAYQNNVPQASLPVGSYNGFANWFSVAHYLFYTYSPKLGAILRYENFDDAQGQRTGFAGLYTAITGGIQYRINKSMILRPELRYDYNSLQRPYEGKHGIFTAASDLIIRW
jgi:hypothetical protein